MPRLFEGVSGKVRDMAFVMASAGLFGGAQAIKGAAEEATVPVSEI